MTAPHRIRAELTGLAALSGPIASIPREVAQRPLDTILREFAEGGHAVSTTACAWSTAAPTSRAALDAMQSQLVGLGRLVGELRQHLEQGGRDG